MTRRAERIGNLIRNVVADGIRTRLSDPRIEPLTSITRVEVSPDLSVAKIFVSVYATPERREACYQALRRASGRLRSLVADEVRMRSAPRLEFKLDESIQRSFETVQALDAVLGPRAADAADPAEAPGEAGLAEGSAPEGALEPESEDV